MDLQVERLSQGERIAAGSALALFVCMFLGWFNFGFATSSAWDSLHYASPVLAIAIAATLAIAFLKAGGRSLGDVPDGTAIFVLGCAAVALILFRLIDPVSAGEASPFGGGGEGGGSAEPGLFLGLIAAAGIAAGGYLATEGRALDRLRGLFEGGGAMPPSAPPPPPPPSHAPPVGAPPVRREGVSMPAAAPAPAPASAPAPAPAPAAAPAARCAHCGAPTEQSDRFCGACGRPVVSP